MKKVVIIGGGIAGLFASKVLCRAGRKVCEVTVVDKRSAQQNLPLLPDLVGHRHDPATFQYPLVQAARQEGFAFCNEAAISIDTTAREVKTETQILSYDYLLLATGTQTHLRHMASHRDNLLTLDCAADAVAMRECVAAAAPKSIVVAGGSYTGVEIVTQLQCSLQRAGRSRTHVLLLNRRDRTCHSLPPWMSRYVEANLQSLGIDVRHGTTLDDTEGGTATLSTRETLDDAVCIWTAGVTVPPLIGELGLPLTSDGRLETEKTLRVTEDVFVAGDTSGFQQRGKPVRMSVQFAVMSGKHAACNIMRDMAGKSLRVYRHVDLGYVVPMANLRGCGKAMGVPIRGPLTIVMHYVMGLYRTFGRQQRKGLVKAIARQMLQARKHPGL